MAASTAAQEVQNLLRFLTTDAKVPLAAALPKIGALRKQGFTTPDAIAKAVPAALRTIFDDDKVLKQVTNAARRISNPKKRATSDVTPVAAKRAKSEPQTTEDAEAQLALPTTETSIDEMDEIEIETNRAPLFLAFTVSVLKYTMPEQPLSSRLSLAQAVVSANSQSKAKSIGIMTGATAEDEGWAQGQPKVKILNREIAVMRRQYVTPVIDSKDHSPIEAQDMSTHEALWGLDLDALRKSNSPLAAGKLAGSSGPPIHTPQAARSYLLKSISIVETKDEAGALTKPKSKRSVAEINAGRERAVALTLKAIDSLCQSWTSVLTEDELDRRAWSWYVNTRPEVKQGQAGWGQRGIVRLGDILELRRQS